MLTRKLYLHLQQCRNLGALNASIYLPK